MSGYGEAPPLTGADIEPCIDVHRVVNGRCENCGLRFGDSMVVRDVAFLLRIQGRIHHNTARKLARSLEREGLLK
jgi:hypothetical protein